MLRSLHDKVASGEMKSEKKMSNQCEVDMTETRWQLVSGSWQSSDFRVLFPFCVLLHRLISAVICWLWDMHVSNSEILVFAKA
jgi:hypothetical protein